MDEEQEAQEQDTQAEQEEQMEQTEQQTNQNQYQNQETPQPQPQPQNAQEGIQVIIGGRIITLSPLLFEDFPLTYIIERSDIRNPTEQQAMAMVKLINKIISRSRLTPEEIELLRGRSQQELLRTYHQIAGAIERTLLVTLTS